MFDGIDAETNCLSWYQLATSVTGISIHLGQTYVCGNVRSCLHYYFQDRV